MLMGIPYLTCYYSLFDLKSLLVNPVGPRIHGKQVSQVGWDWSALVASFQDFKRTNYQSCSLAKYMDRHRIKSDSKVSECLQGFPKNIKMKNIPNLLSDDREGKQWKIMALYILAIGYLYWETLNLKIFSQVCFNFNFNLNLNEEEID